MQYTGSTPHITPVGIPTPLMIHNSAYPTPTHAVVATGSCASGGGKPFYFNPSAQPLDDPENLLWFHNYTVKDGSIAGNGANDGTILTAAKGSQAPVKAVMIVDATSGGE